MPIRLECDCGQVMQVRDGSEGKKVKCPSCGVVFVVPESGRGRLLIFFGAAAVALAVVVIGATWLSQSLSKLNASSLQARAGGVQAGHPWEGAPEVRKVLTEAPKGTVSDLHPVPAGPEPSEPAAVSEGAAAQEEPVQEAAEPQSVAVVAGRGEGEEKPWAPSEPAVEAAVGERLPELVAAQKGWTVETRQVKVVTPGGD